MTSASLDGTSPFWYPKSRSEPWDGDLAAGYTEVQCLIGVIVDEDPILLSVTLELLRGPRHRLKLFKLRGS